MDEHDQLTERFEAERSRLRALAYRMLGSLSEADDAVQEAWLRLSRTDAGGIDNLAGWLTRVVSRLCLDVLRARTARREQALEPQRAGPHAVGGDGTGAAGDGGGGTGPEHEAVLADSVGLALLVVLDRLGPAERVAFVLHDLFAVPFDEVAPIVGRTPVAAKKLASRARRRVHGASPVPAADLARQRHVVDAFLAAARGGDIDALLAVLAPDVVRRADRAAVPAGVATELRGARAVADETATNVARAAFARPALVAGAVGIVVAPQGRLLVALALTVEDGRIAEIDVVADPARLRVLDVAVSPPS
jgi:RNA polymerase sigma-70 factor (ECF subfamily)